MPNRENWSERVFPFFEEFLKNDRDGRRKIIRRVAKELGMSENVVQRQFAGLVFLYMEQGQPTPAPDGVSLMSLETVAKIKAQDEKDGERILKEVFAGVWTTRALMEYYKAQYTSHAVGGYRKNHPALASIYADIDSKAFVGWVPYIIHRNTSVQGMIYRVAEAEFGHSDGILVKIEADCLHQWKQTRGFFKPLMILRAYSGPDERTVGIFYFDDRFQRGVASLCAFIASCAAQRLNFHTTCVVYSTQETEILSEFLDLLRKKSSRPQIYRQQLVFPLGDIPENSIEFQLDEDGQVPVNISQNWPFTTQ